MIGFEIKKTLFKRINIIFILIGLLVTIAIPVILFCTKDNKQRSTISNALKEEISESDKEEYKQEYEKLHKELFADYIFTSAVYNRELASQDGKYGKTILDDDSILADVNSLITRIEDRKQNVSRISDEASLYSDYSLMNYFEKEDREYIADTFAITRVIDYSYIPLISCVMVVFATSGIFAIEKKTGLKYVILDTEKSYESLIGAKLISGVIFSVVVCTLNWGSYLLFTKILYGMSHFDYAAPLWYANGFEFCKSGVSVIHYMLMVYLFSIVMTITVMFLAYALSNITAKTAVVALIISFLVGAANLVEIANNGLYKKGYSTADKNIISYYTFIRLYRNLKKYNPFSLIDIKYYFTEPRFFSVGNLAVEIWIIPFFICLLLIVCSFLVIVKTNKYPKRTVR